MSSTPATRKPFASRVHIVLIGLLILSLVLMAQPFSKTVYQAGLGLLVVSTILQIGASNAPGHAGLGRTVRIIVTALVIVAIVFGVGIYLVPTLIHMGG